MNTDIVKSQKPEERELEKKRAELDSLEEELTQRELELANLKLDIRNFEIKYLRIVGTRYAKLDELEAKIAEACASLNPGNNEAAENVADARNRAKESAKATSDIPATPRMDKMQSSENLKILYRNVARKIHPDLCTNADERLRRERLMKEANQAYADGDEKRLQNILDDWESSPESVKGEDIGAILVRILRKIAQVEDRLRIIKLEMDVLNKSDLCQIKIKVEEAEKMGHDLLASMASRLDDEISQAEDRLREVIQKKNRNERQDWSG